MSDYNFSNINDKDFEILCADLLSKEFNARIERFKPGKDGGVDGRFFSDGNEIIIQCKHWLKSGYNNLKYYLKNTELPKIKKLKPARYILTTTIELSRAQKSELKLLLSPYIKLESDIFGAENINDLLKTHPDVEQNHYKLWLTSTTVLKTLLNNAIIGRSKFKLQEFQEKSHIYVETYAHKQAINKLHELHSVILIGAPGIGKTTLAEQLCLFYVIRHGFELCFIEDDITEAEKYWKPKVRQIFYFDDFLGQTYLSAINNHKDSHVVHFINRIQQDPNKRFILTSRTNILNQGKRLSQTFHDANLNRNEFEIKINELNKLTKAHILYNHIWHSKLTEEYIEQIYHDNHYMQIINHKNFNPRLIDFITDVHKIVSIPPDKYWNYIQESLNNPADIWKHLFDTQIDDLQQLLVLLVFWNGKSSQETIIRSAYEKTFKKYSSRVPGNINLDFKTNIEVSVKALLNKSINNKNIFYELFNPSIGDYILNNYCNNSDETSNILIALCTTSSLNNFIAISNSKKLYIEEDIIIKITQNLANNLLSAENRNYEYTFRLAYFIFSKDYFDIELKNKLKLYIQNLNFSNIKAEDWQYILKIVISFMQKSLIEKKMISESYFILNVLETINDYDDFLQLSELIKILKENNFTVPSELFEKQLEDYLYDHINEFVDEKISVNCHMKQLGPDDYDFEKDYIYSQIIEIMENILDEIKIPCGNIELGDICDSYDIDELIEFQRDVGHYENYGDSMRDIAMVDISETEEIDDLFDKG